MVNLDGAQAKLIITVRAAKYLPRHHRWDGLTRPFKPRNQSAQGCGNGQISGC